MNKLISILFVLISFSAFVSADSDNYDIDTVYIDGVELSDTGNTSLGIELGDTVEVKVVISSTSDADYVDYVAVQARIGGYEYGDMEATSSTFDIEPGNTYIKTLELELPEDLDVCVAEEDYDECEFTIYIEVFDGEDRESEEYDVFIERQRHNLIEYDLVYDSTINSGDDLQVEVRLQNLGEKKEEDIKITLEIPELGIEKSEYMDELAADELDNEDEEDSDSLYFFLNIPKDADGMYSMNLLVEYNRGHDVIEDSYVINVNEDDIVTDDDTKDDGKEGVNIDLKISDEDMSVGEEMVYTFVFENNNEESETYTIEVLGEDQWAKSNVEPSLVSVEPGSSEEAKIYLTPSKEGEYSFTLQVLDKNDNLIAEENVDVEVESGADTSKWLKVLFVVVVIIIVIIILIVAFRKMKDDDDDDYPLEPKEGQTYY